MYDFSDCEFSDRGCESGGVQNVSERLSPSGLEHQRQDETAQGIRIYSKCAHGKSKDRKLPCYFCEKFVFHMPRHLESRHVSEPSVAAVLAKVGLERLSGLKQLANMAVFKHNSDVLKNGDGVLIVGRSPKKAMHSQEDFLPCTFCLAFYVKQELYRHCST